MSYVFVVLLCTILGLFIVASIILAVVLIDVQRKIRAAQDHVAQTTRLARRRVLAVRQVVALTSLVAPLAAGLLSKVKTKGRDYGRKKAQKTTR